MKIVILAAGLGSRLDKSEQHLPKPLTQLANGKSILGYQLDSLSLYLSLQDIFIVVGYQKEVIMNLFPDLTYIYNPLFAQENTAKSLERALKKIDEDVLWLNGDVIFDHSIIKQLLKGDRTSMVVNRTAVAEEEVKYRADEKGRILQVSKEVQSPQGEALGINLFKKEDLPLLKKNLALCQSTDYFEKGIELGIQQGQTVWTTCIDVSQCMEIDFPEDLLRANQMLRKWINAGS